MISMNIFFLLLSLVALYYFVHYLWRLYDYG